MANDDRRSDQFIREVDEELRRAQLKELWNRFAPLIIGICVLIVAVTAGYRGWIWWREREAAEAGDRFLAALETIESGEREEGEAALQAIAAGADGYAALAELRLAGERAAAGGKAEALAAYDNVAANDVAAAPLRDVARIRGALLALDMGDLAGAGERAEPLNQAGNAWRHHAREVLGTAAYKSGSLAPAREIFAAIQEDAQAPQDLWLRAGLMISLIDGQLAAPAAEDGDAAHDTDAAPGPSTESASDDDPAAGPESNTQAEAPTGAVETPSEAPIPPQ